MRDPLRGTLMLAASQPAHSPASAQPPGGMPVPHRPPLHRTLQAMQAVLLDILLM